MAKKQNGEKNLDIKEKESKDSIDAKQESDAKNKEVLLKKEEVENKKASGIILTTETKSLPTVGEVVAVGPQCENDLKEKDRVVFKEYSGTKVKLDGVEYIVIDEKDVLACIE